MTFKWHEVDIWRFVFWNENCCQNVFSMAQVRISHLPFLTNLICMNQNSNNSSHLSRHPLTSFERLCSFSLYNVTLWIREPKTGDSSPGGSSQVPKGRIASLHPLAIPSLTNCWLMFNLMFTRPSRLFSAKLLSRWLDYSLCPYLKWFLCISLYFFLLNPMRFLFVLTSDAQVNSNTAICCIKHSNKFRVTHPWTCWR